MKHITDRTISDGIFAGTCLAMGVAHHYVALMTVGTAMFLLLIWSAVREYRHPSLAITNKQLVLETLRDAERLSSIVIHHSEANNEAPEARIHLFARRDRLREAMRFIDKHGRDVTGPVS